MTLTASPPRAVSLYLTFNPAAVRAKALTRHLGVPAAVIGASGEFLGRIDFARASLAFFFPLWVAPSELNVLASGREQQWHNKSLLLARSPARCVERLLHWHRTPVDCGEKHREGSDGRRAGAVRWGIQRR